MAITQAVCDVLKTALLDGKHLPGHTYKIALYTSAASLGAGTTAYTTSNEVVGTGYTAGGATLAGRTVALVGTTGVLDFTDPTWPASTITARGALIYNDSLAGKDALFVLDFGADITSTADTFTVDLPAQGAGTSLFRLP